MNAAATIASMLKRDPTLIRLLVVIPVRVLD